MDGVFAEQRDGGGAEQVVGGLFEEVLGIGRDAADQPVDRKRKQEAEGLDGAQRMNRLAIAIGEIDFEIAVTGQSLPFAISPPNARTP